jgi:hypothetical protein
VVASSVTPLTNKQGGDEFDETDEEIVRMLATQAAADRTAYYKTS